MGLDMYLILNRDVSKYLEDDEGTIEAIRAVGGRDLEPRSITYRAAYWRKANQIHKWFVDNVQDGRDDCQKYYVGKDSLQKLVDLCKRAEAVQASAGEILPPSEGFFFGSTKIDDGYWYDIRQTIEQLEAALSVAGKFDYFEYYASW